MKFKIGDKVSFLNETGFAEVKKIISEFKVLVKDQDGFDRECFANELVASSNVNSYDLNSFSFENQKAKKVSSEKHEKQNDKLHKRFNHLTSYGGKDTHVVDLHIDKLYDSYEQLSNHQILAIQMNRFKIELQTAFKKRTKKLIVIHGKGKGVLKDEISIELRENFPELSFNDASYSEFGYEGATEILIR